VIEDLASGLEYNEVGGYHSRPLKDIIAQTYDLQLSASPNVEYKSSEPLKLEETKEMISAFRKVNIAYRDAFRNMKKPL
jgi:hypothetical protein